MRIVWVEDSQVLRHTLAVFCEKHKAESKHIADIDEFCKSCAGEISGDDIVLLDILFDKAGERDKVGRGYEALRCLEEAGKTDTPVVILTVLDEEEVGDRVRAFDSVRCILRKPVTPEELEEALSEAWNWKTSQKEG